MRFLHSWEPDAFEEVNSHAITITVQPNGDLRMIYHDEIAALLIVGASRIVRASHVEPVERGWTADLSPVAGPVLGPFKLRHDALDAEAAWLQTEMGL